MWALKEQAYGLGLCISNKLPGEVSCRRARRRAPCAPRLALLPPRAFLSSSPAGLSHRPGVGPQALARLLPQPLVTAMPIPSAPRCPGWRVTHGPSSQILEARKPAGGSLHALEGEQGLGGVTGPSACAREPSCLEDQRFQVPGYLGRWP